MRWESGQEIGYYSLTVTLGRCVRHTVALAISYLALSAKVKCSQHALYKGKWIKRGEMGKVFSAGGKMEFSAVFH